MCLLTVNNTLTGFYCLKGHFLNLINTIYTSSSPILENNYINDFVNLILYLIITVHLL